MRNASVQRVRPWRRAAEVAQAVVVLGLPFVRIRGESALRFDVASSRLHVFGATIWMDDLFVVLAATLCLIFAFLLATLLFGRLWCGWACPQTALIDLTAFLERARRRGGWRLAGSYLAVASASVVVAANLLWYFVPPAEFFRGVAAFSLSPVVGGAWILMAGVLFADIAFWRQQFCATTCPYAKFQGALLDRYSMVIAYDARRSDDCTGCKACVRACPVGIDIRDGLQAACTSCGECIDACAPIMARLKRAPKLVGYFFGAPGTLVRFWRPAAVALAALTVASFALTVAVGADRNDLEMTVTSAGDLAARRLPAGESYHGLSIALENRGRERLHVAFALRAPGLAATLKPDEVVLAPGEHRRMHLAVLARGLEAGRSADARLAAVAREHPEIRAERAVPLVGPEAP